MITVLSVIKQGDITMLSQNGIEYVNCNLCGANDTKLVFWLPVHPQHIGKYNRDVWNIVRCRRCGLIYENPRPDAAALQYFYTFDNLTDRNFVQDWFVNNADLSRTTWQRLLRAMRRYRSSGHLLDVGCGAGSFLVEAGKAGFEVVGQDITPFFVDYCRSQQGLTMYEGKLENLGLEESSFDCLTAFDVIEHHPDPRSLLAEMRRIVKPGGLVVIGTHDVGNLFARIYGRHWRHMSAIGHLTYFTRGTLTEMMETSGFRVVHRGGAHTIDKTFLAEWRNRIVQFFRLIALRAAILGIYKPLATQIPILRRWQYQRSGIYLDHPKLLMRAGNQVIMDDNMVLLALAA